MDERKPSAAVQRHDHKQRRTERKEPAKLHTSAHVMLRDPYALRGSLTSNSNGVLAGVMDVSRSHGWCSASVGERSADSPAQGRVMGKNSLDRQKKGFRGPRSALESEGKSKQAQANLAPFEVRMNDFPELAGVSFSKAGPPLVQRACWGLTPQSTSPPTQTPAFSQKSDRRRSPSHPDPQQIAANAKPESSAASPGVAVMTSWANIASQPPKKPAPVNSNQAQMEEVAARQEDGAPGKKKRKKKKKAKGAVEGVEAESEEPPFNQKPPKIEDEEEFPGLSLALAVSDRLTTSSNASKLCNEGKHQDDAQHQPADQTKEKFNAAKGQQAEMSQKGQKAEKVSGKKSKVPVQLDIGNMLATLEKKQQSQKAKQDSKPVILSIGGGLPVVQKQPLAQKKLPWQQHKIAHNPLDSTSPLVKKGKQREVPKAKKPSPLKKVILKEREERKQRRLLEERGLPPEEFQLLNNAAEEEQCPTEATDEIKSSIEEPDLSALNSANQLVTEADETDKDETAEEQTISPVLCPADPPKIHSRKFRDYCSQMLSKDVDQCVTALLKELVRFQDRLYQKDPMKARMKRRIVMGLREVLKHLKLRKVKCVVISPNCERIQSKGGLDEALYTIIDTCHEQGVPFVFALSRKALGRCVNKAVPVSLVGIFNYDGAQDLYHKMIELSSEARKAYEARVSNLEQTSQAELEHTANTEEELSSLAETAKTSPEDTPLEEPEYIKMWKKMLEKDCNHKFLNFEEQLNSMCLESECSENSDVDERS